MSHRIFKTTRRNIANFHKQKILETYLVIFSSPNTSTGTQVNFAHHSVDKVNRFRSLSHALSFLWWAQISGLWRHLQWKPFPVLASRLVNKIEHRRLKHESLLKCDTRVIWQIDDKHWAISQGLKNLGNPNPNLEKHLLHENVNCVSLGSQWKSGRPPDYAGGVNRGSNCWLTCNDKGFLNNFQRELSSLFLSGHKSLPNSPNNIYFWWQGFQRSLKWTPNQCLIHTSIDHHSYCRYINYIFLVSRAFKWKVKVEIKLRIFSDFVFNWIRLPESCDMLRSSFVEHSAKFPMEIGEKHKRSVTTLFCPFFLTKGRKITQISEKWTHINFVQFSVHMELRFFFCPYFCFIIFAPFSLCICFILTKITTIRLDFVGQWKSDCSLFLATNISNKYLSCWVQFPNLWLFSFVSVHTFCMSHKKVKSRQWSSFHCCCVCTIAFTDGWIKSWNKTSKWKTSRSFVLCVSVLHACKQRTGALLEAHAQSHTFSARVFCIILIQWSILVTRWTLPALWLRTMCDPITCLSSCPDIITATVHGSSISNNQATMKWSKCQGQTLPAE